MIKNFQNLKGHQNPISGWDVTAILLKGLIWPNGGVTSGRVCACSLRSRLVKWYMNFLEMGGLGGEVGFLDVDYVFRVWPSTHYRGSPKLHSIINYVSLLLFLKVIIKLEIWLNLNKSDNFPFKPNTGCHIFHLELLRNISFYLFFHSEPTYILLFLKLLFHVTVFSTWPFNQGWEKNLNVSLNICLCSGSLSPLCSFGLEEIMSNVISRFPF